MVAELVLTWAIGFVILVAASYIGTTMALRGFFGREYHKSEGGQYSNTATECSGETDQDTQ